MKIASHPDLSKVLADALEDGPIPFRRFMEIALYHPQGGYYCRESSRIGPDGDFYTSPHQSPWLGRMIAPLLEKIRRRMDEPTSLPVWEYGPGEGWLAFDILDPDALAALHQLDAVVTHVSGRIVVRPEVVSRLLLEFFYAFSG